MREKSIEMSMDPRRRAVSYTFPSALSFTRLDGARGITNPTDERIGISIHTEIAESQWEKLQRICIEQMDRFNWGRINKFGFMSSRLILNANYSERSARLSNDNELMMVESSQVTTTHDTNVSYILPNTPPRIFEFTPNDQLREVLTDWNTFCEYHGDCRGRVSTFRCNMDNNSTQMFGNFEEDECTVKEYKVKLDDYLKQMEEVLKSREKINPKHPRLVVAPYLTNVVITNQQFHQMVRDSSDIVRYCDDHGTYSLNYFMTIAGRKFPFVEAMLYISPPTYGGVGTPFHLGQL